MYKSHFDEEERLYVKLNGNTAEVGIETPDIDNGFEDEVGCFYVSMNEDQLTDLINGLTDALVALRTQENNE